MNEIPIFTVIVPTYNRANLLRRAIDSILAQTFKEFELIIVDDGSKDNTNEIVRTYEDKRIVYIYKENGGLNSARNRGLEKARGKYIAFCDSDDCWLPEKLEKHLQKYHEDNEIKVVYDLTGLEVIENGKRRIVLARNDANEGWCYREVLEKGYLTSPTFLSCEKECIVKIGMMPMDFTNCEDDDFCFSLCKYFKVGLVKEILGIYYSDASNRISTMKKTCAIDFLKLQDKWSDEIIRMCGTDVLKRRYLHASYKFLELNEFNTAKKVFEKACKIGKVSFNKIRRCIKRDFIKREEIIIYGIGDWGEKVYNALKMINFHNFIFAVTSNESPIDELHGVQTKEIAKLNSYVDNLIIISSSKYYNEMEMKAIKTGFKYIISYKEVVNIIFNIEMK